jgi:hypothetical protein
VTVAVTNARAVPQRPSPGSTGGRAPAHRGADRLTVVLLSVAAFLSVLALLGTQMRAAAASHPRAPRVVLVRRIYQTTVVETTAGAGAGPPAVTQSVSSSGGGGSIVAAPATRTS